MSTPTKFSMGGMPRTKTGLVPTSYRAQLDNMSAPKQWGTLPAKPKSAMHRYRGDYVNDRNRKVARERQLARKQKQRSLNISISDSDSCSSSLLVTPKKTANKEVASLAPDKSNKKWDSYCQHISSHKLSTEEERAREQNKNNSISYLRSESLKRQNRKVPKKKTTEDQQQKDAESKVRNRKPPVPRLSRLARSGGNKENRGNRQMSLPPRANTVQKKKDQPNEKAQPSKKTKAKPGYLDFISKKRDSPPKPAPRTSVTDAEAYADPTLHGRGHSSDDEKDESPSSNSVEDDDEDDDSRFRSQIERIVERAAKMVLAEQHKSRQSPKPLHKAAANENGEAAVNPSPCTNDVTRDNTDGLQELACDTDRSVCSHDILQKQSNLATLEDKVKSMSSSVTIDNDWLLSSSSQKSEDTEDLLSPDRSLLQRKDRSAVNALHTSLSESFFSVGPSSSDSISEVVPRAQIQPSQQPTWQHGFESSIDSSSCTTSSYSELESTSGVSGIRRALEAISHGHLGTGMPPVDENSTTTTSPRHENETVTEILPRKQIRPHQRLDCWPEISVPPAAHPAVDPIEELQWEDEPLPRGYASTSNHCDGQTYEDGAGISLHCATVDSACTQGKPESLVDDMFSLFG